MFIEHTRRAARRNNNTYHIEKCRQYVARNLTKPLNVADVAAQTGLSCQYLSTLFSRSEGITLKQYILREKINAAKNMLLYTEIDIDAIAHLFGFASQSHFTQTFRRFTDSTPAAFRRSLRG